MSDLFTKEIRLGNFQKVLQHIRSATSKQKNMTIISQKNRNKGKPYIFTHDPKLINSFGI